ncbi:MAG: hypothetical protein AUK31_05370 [Fibrobacteres bacterium CG2_30_45_31]|nr:MAG: hypothetical protein AUK31_05370 [Fibrobacteres bacterium CG2_30_45_31]
MPRITGVLKKNWIVCESFDKSTTKKNSIPIFFHFIRIFFLQSVLKNWVITEQLNKMSEVS